MNALEFYCAKNDTFLRLIHSAQNLAIFLCIGYYILLNVKIYAATKYPPYEVAEK